jgi:hypothetical protein
VSEFLTLGRKVFCKQCQAVSARTNQRCRCPAVRGMGLCANHRPSGRGPLSEEGRRRCAAAKTIHGNDTRLARKEYSFQLRKLYVLELQARKAGLLKGPKSPGRKPGW